MIVTLLVALLTALNGLTAHAGTDSGRALTSSHGTVSGGATPFEVLSGGPTG
jgi:hypothetical protein